ncbi:MAG: putative lipid II flippase FtsW [Granulosicoccaceae bacterium]
MSEMISRIASGRLAPRVNTQPDSSLLLRRHALLLVILALALFGVVMITSSSMAFASQNYGSPFYFAKRQLFFLILGLGLGLGLYQLPLAVWEKYGPHMIIMSMFFLLLVLIPGIGKEVNGSRRWIDLGLFTVQVSESAKLFIIVYLAGYLVRRGELVQTTFGGFARPLGLICAASVLLLLEPDFGAAVVIICTALLMLYVAGVRFTQFAALIGVLSVLGTLLIVVSPYRMRRFASFLDPFSDPFNSGFQLTQSLIAIGSGSISGVGLGSSVQKLFYLPEAHTDFLFAVLCEELGLIGALVLICVYSYIVWRSFRLARIADEQGNRFAGFIAMGIGGWIGLQAFINIGVNMGMLPTKGITLPFMSYGGSSALVFAASFALLLRVEAETRAFAIQRLKPRRSSK